MAMKCPVCEGETEAGYVQGGRFYLNWMKEKSLWRTGERLGTRKGFFSGHRCVKCRIVVITY